MIQCKFSLGLLNTQDRKKLGKEVTLISIHKNKILTPKHKLDLNEKANLVFRVQDTKHSGCCFQNKEMKGSSY